MREFTVEERIERGRQAERLLAPGSLLQEAIETAKARVLREWLEGDGAGGEKVHATVRAFAEVQRSLNIIATDGAVAKTRL